MQNQWGLRKICRCTAPPRQLTENTPFLIFLQEKWSTKNVQNLNKILKTTVEGAKQWLSLQQQKIWKACLNKQVSQAASAPTEILWAFKNIELNAILYFNKMKAAISRDVENFQKLCRLKNIFSTAKSEAIWIRNSPACCNCVQFNIRLEVNKGKKWWKEGSGFALEDEIHFERSFFGKRRLKKDLSLYHSGNNLSFSRLDHIISVGLGYLF